MKNLFCHTVILAALLLIGARQTQAQYVTIPDAGFVSWLQTNYPSCMSGNQLDTTCFLITGATSVDLSWTGIDTIEGIEYFDNLQTLYSEEGFISYIPALPPLLTSLTIVNNELTVLPALPATLTTLNVEGNQLTSLPALPPGLLTCDIASNGISPLPVLPNSLAFLNCSRNGLTSIPALPPSLSVLLCSGNSLTSLPSLFNTIHYMDCSGNSLSSLPTLPTSLDTLICSDNTLSGLPALPSSLLKLKCETDQLNSLPSLPSGLLDLDCSVNHITSLPALPSSLSLLDCSNNLLTSLPSLSANLLSLNCNSNTIATLPSLPAGLVGLEAYSCQLTSLPSLPSSLRYLYCPFNQLTYLPPLPAGLDNLQCFGNQITWLPALPDSMSDLDISGNPIYCLPELHYMMYFEWNGTNIHCKPSNINIDDATPSLSTIPLCEPTDTCPFFWNISGIVYFDVNGNCVRDAGDSLLKNIPVELDSGSVQLQRMYTDNFGRYSFRTGFGTYKIHVDTTNAPYVVVCPSTFYQTSILSAIDSVDDNMDFSLQCNTTGGFDLAALAVGPYMQFVPGQLRTLGLEGGDAMMINNISCATGVSGSVEAILSGPVTYYNYLGLPPTSVNGDTITWVIADFATVHPTVDFNVTVYADTTAAIGDTICITLNVYPTADNNPSNNSLSHCYPVVNSCDPNEKMMEPAGAVDTSTQWFSFTVFFQNTGTAAATQIYILDTLDADLDASTFTYISSSHNVVTQLLAGNVLRFNYPFINLPDSTTNEPASHGYVQYKVKRKAGLPVNTVISNTAYIYFDLNPAVVTNTASAVLTTTTGVIPAEAAYTDFEVYPNPATGEFRIKNSKCKMKQVDIYNLVGGNVYSSKMNGQLLTVNCQLAAGTYFIKVTTENGVGVKRLVKE